MTEWQTVFLGVIALGVIAMAVTQVLVVLNLLQTSRQLTEAVQEMRREVRPILDKAHQITDDAARVTALAVVQVERIDWLMTSVASRAEETMSLVQGAVQGPVRQGAAIVAAFRAVLAGIRTWQASQPAAAREEDDPLFVG